MSDNRIKRFFRNPLVRYGVAGLAGGVPGLAGMAGRDLYNHYFRAPNVPYIPANNPFLGPAGLPTFGSGVPNTPNFALRSVLNNPSTPVVGPIGTLPALGRASLTSPPSVIPPAPNLSNLPLTRPALNINAGTLGGLQRYGAPQFGEPQPFSLNRNGLFNDGFGGFTHSQSADENKQFGYWGRSAYENPFGNGFLIGGAGPVYHPDQLVAL